MKVRADLVNMNANVWRTNERRRSSLFCPDEEEKGFVLGDVRCKPKETV